MPVYPPWTSSSPLKIGLPKRKVVSQPPFLQGLCWFQAGYPFTHVPIHESPISSRPTYTTILVQPINIPQREIQPNSKKNPTAKNSPTKKSDPNSKKKTSGKNQIQVIQSDLLIPKRWRSLNPSKGSLNNLTIPKRSRLESPGSQSPVKLQSFSTAPV